MPTYTHKCFSCNLEFENIRPIERVSESPNCPTCGSHKTARKYTPVMTLYKGEGFYNTDNKKE